MRELLDRLQAEDWSSAVDLYSSDYVAAEVEAILRSVRPRRRVPTVEGLLRSDPEMPREVAEYEVERARRDPPPNPFFGDLYGIESEADLDGMEPPEIFARYLHGCDYRWRWRAHVRALIERHPQHRESLEEQLQRSSSPWSGEVLGDVVNGERAYVLFGGPDEPVEVSPRDFAPRVGVLRSLDGRWLLSSDIIPGHVTMVGPVRVPDGEGGWVNLT